MTAQATRVNDGLEQAAAVALKHNALLQIKVDGDAVVVILIKTHASALKHNLQSALLLTRRLQDALASIGVAQFITGRRQQHADLMHPHSARQT